MGERRDASGGGGRGQGVPGVSGGAGSSGHGDPPGSSPDGIDDRATVAALLRVAGLDPPADEIDRLAGLYPGLRRSVERFHAVDAGDESTAAVFRAGEVS